MAKSKTRKKSNRKSSKPISWGGGGATKRTGRTNIILAAVAVGALLYGGYYFWRMFQDSDVFQALAVQGQASLDRVETPPNTGRGHLNPGQSHFYTERFPTSGIHYRVPVDPGFYEKSQPATRLVHSIEHGHIVIYYDNPGSEAMQLLKAWSSLYGGNWDGVVASRSSGLGSAVVLTAWRKRLRLDEFDPAAAAAFIDAFRGRGPENSVR